MEEKIRELTERIEKLEKSERRRSAKEIAKDIGNIIVVLAIAFSVYFVYKDFVKPYKEKVDYVNDKIETIQGFLDDKLSGIGNLFK